MNTVLGIDTGGTYTDAVLLDPIASKVLSKAKSPTTREDLAIGIEKSIGQLDLKGAGEIEKVVLSTTLATNAIVEGEGRPTGLILIGDRPKGELPETNVAQVRGRVNIKGKEVIPLDEDEVLEACRSIAPQVEAIAVSGMMSVRNASQELRVKAIVQEECGLPVVCGHELSSQLGFHDRTVTTVLNASLIPIIQNFIGAVQRSLARKAIDAPIYMVKGDGNLASLNFIENKPIESILSGPAASIIGALGLAGVRDGIVVDMGGTTTDSGIVLDRTLKLSPIGARVGDWQTQIDSAMISTCGLGGDTAIVPGKGHPHLTGGRVLPACRGNAGVLTPTDILHYTGDFVEWDREPVVAAAREQAAACNLDADTYVAEAQSQILDMIEGEVLELYDAPGVPVIAIGAPAKTWYTKVASRDERDVLIPEHYEVANAVGAAMAAVEERVTGYVRPDEENEAFLGQIAGENRSFKDKDEAVAFVSARAEELSLAAARSQGGQEVSAQVFTKEIIDDRAWKERYVRTEIRAVAKANDLKLKHDASRLKEKIN